MKDPETVKLWRAFGSWIRDRREQLKLSQDGVADKVGVDRQTIYRLEAGKSGTKRSTVIAIAEALNLNVDEALIRSGFANPNSEFVETGFFKGIEKLSPEQRDAVRRAMQAMIDAFTEQEHDTNYIDDDFDESKELITR